MSAWQQRRAVACFLRCALFGKKSVVELLSASVCRFITPDDGGEDLFVHQVGACPMRMAVSRAWCA